MGRPCKSVYTKIGAATKAETAQREEAEKELRGTPKTIKKAPKWLTKEQKKIRNKIVKEAEKVLADIDCYIVDQCAIAIDRLQDIERQINESPELMFDKSVIAAEKQYSGELFRCCSELSLSPQSRAKLAAAGVKEPEQNPILTLLGDE